MENVGHVFSEQSGEHLFLVIGLVDAPYVLGEQEFERFVMIPLEREEGRVLALAVNDVKPPGELGLAFQASDLLQQLDDSIRPVFCRQVEDVVSLVAGLVDVGPLLEVQIDKKGNVVLPSGMQQRRKTISVKQLHVYIVVVQHSRCGSQLFAHHSHCQWGRASHVLQVYVATENLHYRSDCGHSALESCVVQDRHLAFLLYHCVRLYLLRLQQRQQGQETTRFHYLLHAQRVWEFVLQLYLRQNWLVYFFHFKY